MACCGVIVLISSPGHSLSGETQNSLSFPICFLSSLSPQNPLSRCWASRPGVAFSFVSHVLALWSFPFALWEVFSALVLSLQVCLYVGGIGCHILYKLFPTALSWPLLLHLLFPALLSDKMALLMSRVWELFLLTFVRDPCIKHLSCAGCSAYESGLWPCCLLSWKGRQTHMSMEMGPKWLPNRVIFHPVPAPWM